MDSRKEFERVMLPRLEEMHMQRWTPIDIAWAAWQARDAEVERLRDALQDLYDEQNGPPLIRDAESWQKAMQKARKALGEES